MTQLAGPDHPKRILFVQKAGDFREAHRRRLAGLGDQYYGHSYVLLELERLAASFGEVAVMCCKTSERYTERLSERLVAIGAAADPIVEQTLILDALERWRPSHLIVNGPMNFVIKWGLAARCEILCILADSFNGGLLRRWLRYYPLGRLLNHKSIKLIGNHGVNACKSLANIGVDPTKILPWDWPYQRSPTESRVRAAPAGRPARLLYVGTLQRDKGVGDLIHAIAILRRAGLAILLTVVGAGTQSLFSGMASELGVEADVIFTGLLPNERVIQLMQESDVLVVPSRHIYPEGLPLVIYEALCSRIPIVASDHPMFRGHLVHGQTASIFSAGKPKQLAARIAEILTDATLYSKLSANSDVVWEGLQNPVKWGHMIERWLRQSDTDQQWLKENSLAYLGST